jgi:hypothetical protein
MKLLTEDMAAQAYAQAWTLLDSSAFCALLAEDSRYASQWVFDELVGKDEISKYLEEKIETIRARSSASRVQAELGEATLSSPGRSCVVLTQGEANEVSAVVLFEVDGKAVTRFDMCIPDLFCPIRSRI